MQESSALNYWIKWLNWIIDNFDQVSKVIKCVDFSVCLISQMIRLVQDNILDFVLDSVKK